MDAASSFLLLGFEGDLFITLGLGAPAQTYDHQWPCGMWPVGMWDTDCVADTISGGRQPRRRRHHLSDDDDMIRILQSAIPWIVADSE